MDFCTVTLHCTQSMLKAETIVYRMVDNQDTVAIWMVPLQDKVHKIEFEHGTTTGKRIIRVDGQVFFIKTLS